MPTISEVVSSGFTEIRMARAGDVINPEDMTWGLYVLNRILDLWNADTRKVWTSGYTDYTLTPALSPHTIGVGGTFNVTQRPVRLEAAAINLGSNTFTQLNVRDAAWYEQQPVPAISTTLPTDVYYEPAWPLGKLYFWGVPSTAYSVRLWTRALLAQVALTDTFSLPPGYQAALELTLAEALASSGGQTPSAMTVQSAKDARAVIFGNNDVSLDAICDAGIPCDDRGGGYDYRTGQIS
jgi:hypothetical protein